MTTSIPPQSLLALDAPMFDAMERAAADHWSRELELAAGQVEVTHALYRAFVSANSRKGAKLPEQIRIPRPGETMPEKRKLNVSEFAFGLVAGGKG